MEFDLDQIRQVASLACTIVWGAVGISLIYVLIWVPKAIHSIDYMADLFRWGGIKIELVNKREGNGKAPVKVSDYDNGRLET